MKYQVQENCLTIYLPAKWTTTMRMRSGGRRTR